MLLMFFFRTCFRKVHGSEDGTPPSVWGWSYCSYRRWWDLDEYPEPSWWWKTGTLKKNGNMFLLDDMYWCVTSYLQLPNFSIILVCFYTTCWNQQIAIRGMILQVLPWPHRLHFFRQMNLHRKLNHIVFVSALHPNGIYAMFILGIMGKPKEQTSGPQWAWRDDHEQPRGSLVRHERHGIFLSF